MPYKDPAKKKAYHARYQQENKEAIAKQKAQHYQENRETILEQKAEYYQENKEAKSEYNAKYREENKEALAEKNAKYREENKEALAAYDAKRYQENREAKLEYSAKYRKDHKQNITYIATVGSDFYFGHSFIGLDARRRLHFSDMRKGKGNPGLRKHFNDLGEEAFKEAFDMQILETFETVEEAMAAEALLLAKYVGTPGCLNVRLA